MVSSEQFALGALEVLGVLFVLVQLGLAQVYIHGGSFMLGGYVGAGSLLFHPLETVYKYPDDNSASIDFFICQDLASFSSVTWSLSRSNTG